MKINFRSLLLCSSVLAAIGTGAVSANAGVVHDASILTTTDGTVSFSFIHKSTTGSPAGANGFTRNLNGDFSYTWTPTTTGSTVVESGSTIDFDQGSFKAFDGSINSTKYKVDLFTNFLSGASSNSLLVGNSFTPTVAVDSFTVTHEIRGDIEATISKLDSSGNVLQRYSDVIFFDDGFEMVSVDGIGQDGSGNFGTFVWGYTNNFNIDTLSRCTILNGANDNCTDIFSTFTSTAGFGFDLAFDGTPRPIPLPPALTLFLGALLGLGGLGVMKRRRSATA